MFTDHANKKQYRRGRILRLIRRWWKARQLARCPENRIEI